VRGGATRDSAPLYASKKSAGDGLGASSATGDRLPRHSAGASIAKIRLFRAAPRIRPRQAKCRALSFSHFGSALVTDENGLAGHFDPFES
jgi:hypothetical protein